MELNTDFWTRTISIIQELSSSLDKKWRQRNRKIDTFFLIIFISKLAFYKAKTGYQIIIDEIWDEFRQNNIILPQEKSFAQSSVCEARQKLKAEIILEINQSISKEFFELNDKNFRWHNFRIFAVDGSWILLPTELRKNGYDTRSDMYDASGKLSCLYHIGTGVVLDTILDKLGDERKIALNHFKKLQPDDVIIYDRGYFGYEFALEHIKKSIHFIMRVDTGNVPKEIEEFINDPNLPNEVILDLMPSKYAVARALKKGRTELKNSKIKIKLVRYQIEEKFYYLATSIVDKSIPINDFSEIYHKRWEVEEHYKLKKSILEIQQFHAKNENGVLQEIYCSSLLINISRIFASEANEILNSTKSLEKKTAQEHYTQKILIYLSKKSKYKRKVKKI